MSFAPTGVLARVHDLLSDLSWVQRSLLVGGGLTIAWVLWDTSDLSARLVKDMVLLITVPGLLAITHGRDLGWRVDRHVLRNTALLGGFVLPFYLVGSSLPTVRAYYPMWEVSSTLGAFLPHAAQLFLLAFAAETYYRGLLCVGIREIGPLSILVSPVVYAFVHVHKPPIELILSAPTDVLFGAVDYRSTSIVPSLVAHGGGVVLLDWLVMHPPIFPPAKVVSWLSWLPVPL